MHTRQGVAEPTQEQGTVPTIELTPDGMYPLEVTLEGRTKHSKFCQSCYKRRDWRCARCAELLHGSAPRKGWQREYFAKKLREVQGRLPL